MKKILIRPLLAAAILCIAGVGYASADTITDTTVGVSYTLTSTFAPEPGTNTYDVTLLVDASAFTGAGGATSGFLQAVAPQFSGATSVVLESGPGTWSVGTPGSTNSSGCMSGGAAAGFVCFSNTSAGASGAVPGTLTFVFDVTLPGTTLPSTSSDIKAVFNSASDGSGTFLGQTSMGIDIQPGTTEVPEPGTVTLLGAGLLGLAALKFAKA